MIDFIIVNITLALKISDIILDEGVWCFREIIMLSIVTKLNWIQETQFFSRR